MEDASYRQRILQTLSKAPLPMGVEPVRIESGIKNWQTAMKHLLELVLESKICGQKTTKGWIFWIETECDDNNEQSNFHKT